MTSRSGIHRKNIQIFYYTRFLEASSHILSFSAIYWLGKYLYVSINQNKSSSLSYFIGLRALLYLKTFGDYYRSETIVSCQIWSRQGNSRHINPASRARTQPPWSRLNGNSTYHPPKHKDRYVEADSFCLL